MAAQIQRLTLSSILLIAGLTVSALPAAADALNLDGNWDGAITTGGRTLRIVFHFETTANLTSGTLTSIDQGDMPIAMAKIEQSGDALSFTVPALAARYNANLTPDGRTMSGTWTQSVNSIALNLTRRAAGDPGPVPAPVAPKPVVAGERDVQLATPTGTLWGTLHDAGKNAPALLIQAGSGPTDRNGNSAAYGVTANMYAQLAQGLAAKGITTLRTDKRGVGESHAALTSESALRFTTYSDDERLWAVELKRQTSAKCIWLLGHSEGALLSEITAQNNPDVCGLVLVSGAGRRISTVMRDQIAASPHFSAEAKAAAPGALAELEAGRTVQTLPAELAEMLRPSAQPYIISWIAYDPATLLAQIRTPVLILQGDNDIQIAVADAKALAAAQPAAKLVVLPGVNHVLKIAPTDRQGNVLTYTDPGLPIAPGVVEAIADFVKAHP